jgi:type VI secretion system protein ImpK
MSGSSFRIDMAGRPLPDDFALGMNPLVNCASHLLAEIICLRTPGAEGLDPWGEGRPHRGRELHSRLEAGLNGFESAARRCGFEGPLVDAAACMLGAALDESLGTAPPEACAGRVLHGSADGDERFFRIVERALQQPAEGLHLLELAYLLLDLGFEGRYRLRPEGCGELKRLRERVYREVCALRAGRPGRCGWRDRDDGA